MDNNNQNPMFKPKNQTGTNFVNTSRIKQANQGNQLGSILGQTVTNNANTAKTKLNNAQNQFQQDADKNLMTTDENKQKFNQSLTNVGTNNESSQDQGIIKNSIVGRYAGPNQLNNADQIQNQVSNVQQAGQLGQTLAGRQSMLQKQLGAQNYNRGKSTLDASLAGNTFDINKTKMLGNILAEQANRANQATQDTSNLYTNINQQQAQNNLKSVNQANIQNENAIGRQIGDTNVREGLLNEIRSQVESGLNNTAPNQLSDVAKSYFHTDSFDPSKQSVGSYAANALRNTGDLDEAGKYYLGQANDLNTKGFTNYKTGSDNQNFYTLMNLMGVNNAGGFQGGIDSSAINQGYQGNLNDILKANLQKTGAQNLSRQGLASDSQINRNNALANVLGKQDKILNLGGPKYEQSKFDVKAQDTANQVNADRNNFVTNLANQTANSLGNFTSGSNRLNRKAYGEAALELNDQGTVSQQLGNLIRSAQSNPDAMKANLSQRSDLVTLGASAPSVLQEILKRAGVGALKEYNPNNDSQGQQLVAGNGLTSKKN